MSQATIPDLPFDGSPPSTVLFEISNTGVSESTDLASIVFGLQNISEKNLANGYAGLDASGLLNPAQIPDISGTYQILTEKDIANGYAGLDATGLVLLGAIPDLPESRIINLITDLAARELLANKVTTVGTPGNDTNYPSEKAVRDALDLKEDSLGFTPEDVTNKVITVGTPGNDTNYPSEKAVRDALDLKEDSLGFTPENIINKVIVIGTPGNDTNYPTEKATRDALDLKEDSLGFTPENLANKTIDLLSPDNTKYPTTLAVSNGLSLYQLLSGKGAANGYAGLDVSQELLIANFPTGAALQVLRRNAGNTALEFATVAGGSQTPWTSNIDAATFNLFNLSYMESNAANPAQSGAVRLGDTEQIMWRNNANNADIGIDVNNDIFNIINAVTITGSSTLNINFQSAVANFDAVNVIAGLDVGGASITSVIEIEFDPGGAILWQAGESISIQTGDMIFDVPTTDFFSFDIAGVPEYTFDAATADFNGNNLSNVAIFETNATFPADIGAIRLGDLEEIAFRNSTNDGNFVITSDDPTLTFKTWETIEFPQATIIEASLADLQILSIDMSGDIVVNGFSILQPGLIESNAGTPADAGFLRMGNTELLAWRNFGDTANITLSVNASDQFAFNSVLTVGNNLIKAVLTPVDGTDAANKTYVDNLVNGLVWKDAADLATTGNITLTGEQVIDGTLTSASRVLVKDQTSGQFNGVYTSGAGAWTRTTDTDTDVELNNMSIFISLGVVNAGSSWTQTTDLPITVDTTVLVYAQIGAGSINPLTTKGDIFGYDTGSTRIPVGTDGQVLRANSAVALGVEWLDVPQPLTTKGDLFTFTTVVARLPVGITGQILSANAALSTGLEWINNDPSPLTSKGDIYTFTTVNERIAVGTNGQVLSANAAQPTGLEWITLPAPGGSQTPWTSDIDADGFDLVDLSILEFRAPSTADPGQSNSISMQDDGGVDNMTFHVNDVSGEFDFITDTNSVPTVTIDSNGIYMIGKILFGPQRITGTDLLRIITFETTASAVNYFNMKGGTAGNGVWLETDGSDTNVDLVLSPKGNSDGSVFIPSRALKMSETTTKTAPTGNQVKFYPKDVAGRAHLFIQDDVGEVDLNLSGGGPQTPWASDIDADGFDLVDLSNIEFRATTLAPSIASQAIFNDAGAMTSNVPTTNVFRWKVNGVLGMQLNNLTLNLQNTTSLSQVNGIITQGVITLNPSGGGYFSYNGAIASPGNSGSPTRGNVFLDSGNLNHLTIRRNDGIDVDLESGGTGDVVGPVSSTDNAIAVFDSVTGKLIQQSGSSLNPILIDDNANITAIKSTQYVNNASFPPTFTPYTQFGNSGTGTFDLENNVPLGSEHSWHVGGTQEYNMTATDFFIFNNNIIQTTGYYQMQAMAAPASSGSALVGRLYQDLGNSNHLTISRNGVPFDLESGGGDVAGPASSTDNAVARFDLATGKLLQNSVLIVDDDARVSDIRSLEFNLFNTFLGNTLAWIQYGSAQLRSNIPTSSLFEWTIGGTSEMNLTNLNLDIRDKNILIGTGYTEFEEITIPSLPSANRGRLYTKDVATETHLFFINSSGEETDLVEHALQTPWTSDIDAARFNLESTGAIDFSLAGALVLPAITQPYITFDDSLAPDAMVINVPTGAEQLLSFNGVEEYTFSTTIFDMHLNQLSNVSFISVTSATAPTIRFNRSTALVGDAGAGEIQFRSGNQIYGEILSSPTNIGGGDETGTMKLRVAQNSFEYDMISLIGSTAGPSFGTISFHQNKMASQINMGGNVLQEVLRIESDDANKASTGFLRLGNGELLAWRNNADNGNHSIAFSADSFVISVNSGTDYSFSETALNMVGNALQNPSEISDVSGNAILDFGTAGASAVNEVTITNAITATSPIIAATGTDANVDLSIRAKGEGSIVFADTDGLEETLKLVQVSGTAINYVEITNSLTGVGPTIAPQGQTDIDLNLIAKGTGLINLNTTTDLLGNNLESVQNIVHDQSVITYNATLAFDFDLDQEQTLAITGDLTTLTTSNRAAGKSKSIFITGDTVNRTLTFNASWRTNPQTATVTITANTFGLLTFGSKGAAETDVFCAYAEFV